MVRHSTSGLQDTEAHSARPDGRRQRGSRNRAEIVSAMLRLVRAGDVAPCAAEVAEAANVSLRTVFRHFEDMDSLYREMCQLVETEMRPLINEPLHASDLEGRVMELAARRAQIFEHVLPLRVAVNARRFKSRFLSDVYDWTIGLERASLRIAVDAPVEADETRFAALETALSFEVWRRLRQDQKLDVDQAEAVMRLMAEKIIR